MRDLYIDRFKWLWNLPAVMLGLIILFAAGPAYAGPLELLPKESYLDRYYHNPAPIHGIGDPAIIFAEGAYWMFSTSSSMGFEVWRSADMKQWENKGLAFRSDPQKGWCTGSFWAPEVYKVDSYYYLFYSAAWYGHGTMRIGAARSDAPQGPYLDLKNEPLFDPGYATIDASLFLDFDGRAYLYYSRDCSENQLDGINTSQIYSVQLNEDFSGIIGEPQQLLTPDQPWEYQGGDAFRWNEGPFVVYNNERYWLFYSANYYQSREYGVGAAFSYSPQGPFTKTENGALLRWAEDEQGNTLVSGPGHNACFRVGDELFTSYHTHYFPHAPSENRQPAIDRMGFHKDGTPFINGPTLAGQLLPLAQLGLRNAMQYASELLHGDEAPGHDSTLLADGDYGIAPSSAGYCWQAIDKENAWVEFRWESPESVDSILIYAPSVSGGTGKLILNGEVSIPVNFSDIDPMPGSCLSYYFAPMSLSSLRLEMSQVNAIAEILATGEAGDPLGGMALGN